MRSYKPFLFISCEFLICLQLFVTIYLQKLVDSGGALMINLVEFIGRVEMFSTNLSKMVAWDSMI